jgi:copper(I)-binding protein
MIRIVALGVLVTALLAYMYLSVSRPDNKIQVVDAWSPAAPPTMAMHAGYLSLQNHSSDSIELVEVSSVAYESIEIHQSLSIDGVLSMRMLPSLSVEPRAKVQFKSGGLHLMMRKPLAPRPLGGSFPVSFKFADGAVIEFLMQVSKTGLVDTETSSTDTHHHHH